MSRRLLGGLALLWRPPSRAGRRMLHPAKRPRCSPMAPPRIGTHNGTFHCDEALACALLRLLPEYQVRSPGHLPRAPGRWSPPPPP